MKVRSFAVAAVLSFILLVGFGQQKAKKEAGVKTAKPVSYAKDIVPIFKKYCLPCHTEDNMNPSELYLDSYDALMKGGKHGAPIRPGSPDSSIMVQKLCPNPPFGDPMPYKFKRPFPADTLSILRKWIAQGGKNN